VDGGLNPRLSGAALKIGTNFAADSWRPECGAIDPCQRRKPPEAVAKGQRLQGSIAPQKSAAEIGGVAASHLLLPRIFSDQAGKPPDKRGFSPPATISKSPINKPQFHRFWINDKRDIRPQRDLQEISSGNGEEHIG